MNTEQTIAKLDELLEKVETLADQCSRQILKTKEAMEGISQLKKEVISLLPEGSSAYRTFDRNSRETTQWWEDTLSGYVAPKDCTYIGKWIDIMKNTIRELEPEFLRDQNTQRKQHFFRDGEEYQAKKRIFNVMKRATNRLVIVDQYLDDTIFDFVESRDPSIAVQMLTGTRKPIFNQLFKTFAAARGSVEAKEFAGCHDRFIIIDGDELWHLGSSINHAGKKAFMMNKIVDQQEKSSFLTSFNAWWSNGANIT